MASKLLKTMICQPIADLHHLNYLRNLKMTTDAKVITGLSLLAILLFITFWFVEALPIIGS